MCSTASGGLSTRWAPGWPGCPPGGRPLGGRDGRRGALGGSHDGGRDEYCECCRSCASNSPTRACSAASSPRKKRSTVSGVRAHSSGETPAGAGGRSMPLLSPRYADLSIYLNEYPTSTRAYKRDILATDLE